MTWVEERLMSLSLRLVRGYLRSNPLMVIPTLEETILTSGLLTGWLMNSGKIRELISEMIRWPFRG